MEKNNNDDIEQYSAVILIPVYNHAATLRDVVSRALLHSEVIVVDDGSTDESIETVTGLNVSVLHHHANRGKGAAIKTGAAFAAFRGYTHMITMDADGQHDPSDIPAFMDAVKKNPGDIIIGKRNFNTANVPFASVFGRAFSNFWIRVQTGSGTGDVQSGFRSYPLSLFDALELHENRYSFEVEVLVKSVWGGIALKDIDISVLYQAGEKRISHFDLFRDNLSLTLLNTKLTFRSFLPIPHKTLQPGIKQEKLSIFKPLRSIGIMAESGMSPIRLSISGGVGVLLGALPLIACHTLVILFTAGYFRLSKLTAVATSQLCAPPFMPALCIEVGYYMRNGTLLTEISLKTLGSQGVERLFEWFLGSLVVGPLMGLIVGLCIYITLLFPCIHSLKGLPNKQDKGKKLNSGRA